MAVENRGKGRTFQDTVSECGGRQFSSTGFILMCKLSEKPSCRHLFHSVFPGLCILEQRYIPAENSQALISKNTSVYLLLQQNNQNLKQGNRKRPVQLMDPLHRFLGLDWIGGKHSWDASVLINMKQFLSCKIANSHKQGYFLC